MGPTTCGLFAAAHVGSSRASFAASVVSRSSTSRNPLCPEIRTSVTRPVDSNSGAFRQAVLGFDPAGHATELRSGVDDLPFQALMVPLPMVMLKVLSRRSVQRFLTEQDHPVQALALQRQHESLDMRIAVRRFGRYSHRLDSALLQHLSECDAERASLSISRYRFPTRKPSMASVRFRATCFIHSVPGPIVIPASSTRRVARSITKSK